MIPTLIVIGIVSLVFTLALCKVSGEADRRAEIMYLQEIKRRERR